MKGVHIREDHSERKTFPRGKKASHIFFTWTRFGHSTCDLEKKASLRHLKSEIRGPFVGLIHFLKQGHSMLRMEGTKAKPFPPVYYGVDDWQLAIGNRQFGTWQLAFDIWHLAVCTCHFALGTMHLAVGAWHLLAHGTLYLSDRCI